MSSAAAAQTTTGTISGRIVDSQGLALPGVTVTVAGPNLQGTLTVVSTDNGDYTIPRVPPGTYTVTFELSGFQRQEKPVTIALSQALTLNTALGPASLTETVDVRPGDGEILTHTADVATNFKQELMATLPTTRDINAVVLKAPGVHPSGPNGSYSIAGSMSFESLYLVNGVNVNENLRGQANNLYIEDAVQETMVATDGISAEYGRFSGGVVNVVTKSGGNRFSGSFRDSLFNDDWRAKVTGNDDHPFLTDTKGRSRHLAVRVRARRTDRARQPVVLHRRPYPQRSRRPQYGHAPEHPLYVRRQEPALRREDDVFADRESPLRRHLYKGEPDGSQRYVQHCDLDGPAQPVHARAAAESLHRRLQRRDHAVVLRRRPLLGAALQLHRLWRHIH